MSETATEPSLQGQMFLFEKPELISKEAHGDLGVTLPEKRFEYCAGVRGIPLTVSEIPAAMKDYPIVFASTEQLIPIAIVGLIDEVNLFVDEKGDWEQHRYVPGYVRRYPFGVAAETGGERIAIVIDRAYKGLQPGGDLQLFENGEPTANTKQAIEFCKGYEEDRIRTEQFSNQVRDLNIVSGQSAQYTPQGETQPRVFAEYVSIDENVLKQIPADKLVELRDAGILPMLYAMVMSLGNWRTILTRRALRYGLNEDTMLKPVLN